MLGLEHSSLTFGLYLEGSFQTSEADFRVLLFLNHPSAPFQGHPTRRKDEVLITCIIICQLGFARVSDTDSREAL